MASNIANVETPGYKEKRMDFQAEIQRSGAGKNSNIKVTEVEPPEGVNSLDGNSVDIEDQLVKSTENQMMFTASIQLIDKRFSMMKYAINEGR